MDAILKMRLLTEEETGVKGVSWKGEKQVDCVGHTRAERRSSSTVAKSLGFRRDGDVEGVTAREKVRLEGVRVWKAAPRTFKLDRRV